MAALQICILIVFPLLVRGCVDGNTTYCSTIDDRQCYESNVVDVCCKTCKDTAQGFMNIPNCTYGDRIDGCRVEVCGDRQAQQCCATCQAYTLLSNNTTEPAPTTSAPEKTKLPAWVIPALAAAGGIIVLILLCVCCWCCCCGGKKGHVYSRSRGAKRRIFNPND